MEAAPEEHYCVRWKGSAVCQSVNPDFLSHNILIWATVLSVGQLLNGHDQTT